MRLVKELGDYEKILSRLKTMGAADKVFLLREFILGDLYFLLRFVCGREDFKHPFLFRMCREVQADPYDILNLWARDHRKSTIITFGFLMQRILGELSEGRHFTAGIFSHTRSLAQAFLFRLKSEFENNGLLQELFPDVLYRNPTKESPLWSIEKGIVLKRKGNPVEATVEAWGVVEGQPIGRHFTELYYDDVVVPSSVTTPSQIAKTTEMLRMSFNLGSKGTKKLWAGTRYHYADSYGFMMEESGLRSRIVQATANGKPDGDPVFLTRDEIKSKYNDMGQYVFSTQMLLSPVPDEQQEFRAEWWKEYYGEYDPTVKKGNRYLLIDPSSGKKGTAGRETDYTVIIAIECRDDDNIYVLSMLRQRLNLKQRTEALFDFHAEFKPERLYGVRYEEVGMQADIEHIREEQKRRRYMFDITPVPARISKEDRIRRLVPYFCSGRIIMPERIDCVDENKRPINLVEVFRKEEYLTFPFSKHDDMMDALSRLAEEKFPLEFPKSNPSPSIEDFHYSGNAVSEDGMAY